VGKGKKCNFRINPHFSEGSKEAMYGCYTIFTITHKYVWATFAVYFLVLLQFCSSFAVILTLLTGLNLKVNLLKLLTISLESSPELSRELCLVSC
jgi:hypothetical protein